MKFEQLFFAKVYRKKEATPYVLSNGTKGTTYPVIVDNGEDTETVNVSEDVYKTVEAGEDYVFITDTNSSYNNAKVRLVSVAKHITDKSITNFNDMLNKICGGGSAKVK